VGVAVKHRQLARQVGEFIEHPPENSMASCNFKSTVIDEGTTFIFGSASASPTVWVASTATWPTPRSQRPLHQLKAALDDFIDNLDDMLLPDLAQQIEKMSVFNVTSTRDALDLLGSDSNQYEKISRSKSLPDLEEDLDLLLKIKDVGATTRREAPVFDIYSDSNEEYSPCNTTPSIRLRKGLGDERVTACRAAPALENHSQPDG
jgi:hypothetical protein